MKLRMVAVGTKPPSWARTGFEEYAKRMPRDMALSLIEIAPSKNHGASEKGLIDEGSRMLSKINDSDWVATLDVGGARVSSEGLAKNMSKWRMQGQNVVLAIGGADGLAPAVSQRANESISLSALTFPHYLVRVIMAEALYRAWSIGAGHPYHRA